MFKNNNLTVKKIKEIISPGPNSNLGVKEVINMEAGDYKCFTSGAKTYFVNEYLVDGSYLFMNDGGSADTKFNFGKSYYTNHVFSFTTKDNNVNAKYLYYYLKDKERIIENTYFQGVGLKNLNKTLFNNFEITLPSIEVQNEIVYILDKFTELVSELKLKLKTRIKQYDYYLKKLLINDDFKEYSISDIGEVKMCRRIFKNQTNDIEGIPFYKIGTFGNKADSYIPTELFEEYREKFPYPKKGDILISASGTIGKTIIFNGEEAYFQDSNIVWIEHDKTIITNEYLYYLLSILDWNATTGGTIKRLYNSTILNTRIKIPSLDVQNKIVKYLNKFSEIVDDNEKGLPKEIELRRKQYEYYRNKLLDFK